MDEQIYVYPLDNPGAEPQPMSRAQFYDEQVELAKAGKSPQLAVGVFNAFIFTKNKQIILQKRSAHKRHNPNRIDKSVGGHIQFGDSPYYTAMIECVQELRVPAVVLRDSEDFEKTKLLMQESLEAVAVLDLFNNEIHTIDNIIDNERVPTAKKTWLFFGVYAGPIKPVDGEATGILYYSLDDLRQEMASMPDIFTPDLHYFMKKFEKEIDAFVAQI